MTVDELISNESKDGLQAAQIKYVIECYLAALSLRYTQAACEDAKELAPLTLAHVATASRMASPEDVVELVKLGERTLALLEDA